MAYDVVLKLAQFNRYDSVVTSVKAGYDAHDCSLSGIRICERRCSGCIVHLTVLTMDVL